MYRAHCIACKQTSPPYDQAAGATDWRDHHLDGRHRRDDVLARDIEIVELADDLSRTEQQHRLGSSYCWTCGTRGGDTDLVVLEATGDTRPVCLVCRQQRVWEPE